MVTLRVRFRVWWGLVKVSVGVEKGYDQNVGTGSS